MDSFKKFKADITRKVDEFMMRGEIFAVNEVAANMMAGVMLMIINVMLILCLILNEVGIFTANRQLMFFGVALSLAIEIPIVAINQKYRGDKKWLKYLLQIGLLLLCAIMSICLNHNVTLMMVIPILISTRYFDAKFTKHIMLLTYAVYLMAAGFTAELGLINLNVFRVADGTVISVVDNLRAAIEASNVARDGYFASYLINDLAPKFIIFLVIGSACIKIAQRGREMIDMQTEYSEKSARIETELDLATKIQTGMLPCIFPAFPEFGQLQLYAKNIPAKEVGGDFYDYFQVDNNRIALVMADVSGKGVGAALFMTISKIVIKNLLQNGNSPSEAMMKANRQLCENNDAGLFVTTWIGVYDSSTDELIYTNAGHNPPIVVRKNGECSFLKGKRGFVLAGMEGVTYEEDRIPLEVGDEIFLYTDGVTEATDTHDCLYGESRLLETLDSISGKTAEEQIEDIIADINLFIDGADQFDDITMMAMRILEK